MKDNILYEREQNYLKNNADDYKQVNIMRNKYRYFDRQIHFNIFCGGFHQFILYCISTNH